MQVFNFLFASPPFFLNAFEIRIGCVGIAVECNTHIFFPGDWISGE